MTNDAFIWNKLKIGDKQSFELVFKVYYPQLCLFANKFTQDFDLAREIVQELFIYLWENKHTLHDKKSVKSYFYVALRFNSIRRVKDLNKKFVQIVDISKDDQGIDFFDEIEYSELQDNIYSSIESMSPQCKRIFRMSRFGHMSYSKIANTLNISQKTVETHMTKALKIIQRSLDNYLSILVILLLFPY